MSYLLFENPILLSVYIVLGYLLGVGTILHIVLQRRDPVATLAWALGILLVPFVGVLLYLTIGRRQLERHVRRRRGWAERLANSLAEFEPTTVGTSPGSIEHETSASILRLTNRMGCRPPTKQNDVTLLVDPQEIYEELEDALHDATDSIHMQFYIFNDDETGKRFRDLLIRKVKEGVRVKVLTDGVGSLGIAKFFVPLVEAGGQHAEFLSVGNIRRHWQINLRNHRKIVVIDGRIGFTGGVNIGDEYTGQKKNVGLWRDTFIRLRGPAVHHLQEVFLDDWSFATEDVQSTVEEYLDYFPEVEPHGQDVVQVVASGPDTETQPIQRMFFAAITQAKTRVYLTTPYFVPDQAMLVALQATALRGVDVRLLVPQKSDMPLVLRAGRSYYEELLTSGVRIYEYIPGVLHSKTLVMDSNWATVGSANMDIRSFRLNFEINIAIYGRSFAEQLAQVFLNDLSNARELGVGMLQNRSVGTRVAESLARTLSPVL